MIASLSGTVIDIAAAHIVLDVGGVGYLLAVRTPTDYTLDQKVSLHTHLAVRETALDLYGFQTRDELDMFEHLLRLPKIGPKSAMQILIQADIELLKKAIVSDDPTYLSKMSGIGKKSAEKIVAGLKDVFEYTSEETSGAFGVGSDDVIDALVALGYSERDAFSVLQKLPPDVTETNIRIKEALKLLGK